jgi:hypothetical protein
LLAELTDEYNSDNTLGQSKQSSDYVGDEYEYIWKSYLQWSSIRRRAGGDTFKIDFYIRCIGYRFLVSWHC